MPATMNFCPVCGNVTASPYQLHAHSSIQADNASPVDVKIDPQIVQTPDKQVLSSTSHTVDQRTSTPQTRPLSVVIEKAGHMPSLPEPPLVAHIDPESWEHLDVFDPLDSEDIADQHVTWHKDVEPHTPVPIEHPPRPTPLRSTSALMKAVKPQRVRPGLLFRISVVVICLLIFGGAFDLLAMQGRGSGDGIVLSATPNNVIAGATVTLRGAHFSPHGRIDLKRDDDIPIVDTGGSIITTADGRGTFTDTVIVGEWGSGVHTMSAEDTVTHKIASFPITVIDQGKILKPPHLQVAQTSLDFGAGDLTTNSSKLVTLMNVGGGQINWRISTLPSWLRVTPTSGSFYSGLDMQLTVAVVRADMAPGVYTTRLIIASNAGEAAIPVRMEVTPSVTFPADGATPTVEPSPQSSSKPTAAGTATPSSTHGSHEQQAAGTQPTPTPPPQATSTPKRASAAPPDAHARPRPAPEPTPTAQPTPTPTSSPNSDREQTSDSQATPTSTPKSDRKRSADSTSTSHKKQSIDSQATPTSTASTKKSSTSSKHKQQKQ